jgi:hypothetical protein
MRKLALLFAAALFVSAPLIAATPSLTYAAAKKKAAGKAGKAEPRGGGGRGEREEVDVGEANSRFARAVSDLILSLSRPWPTAEEGGPVGGGKRGKAAKAPKGKKGRA